MWLECEGLILRSTRIEGEFSSGGESEGHFPLIRIIQQRGDGKRSSGPIEQNFSSQVSRMRDISIASSLEDGMEPVIVNIRQLRLVEEVVAVESDRSGRYSFDGDLFGDSSLRFLLRIGIRFQWRGHGRLDIGGSGDVGGLGGDLGRSLVQR